MSCMRRGSAGVALAVLALAASSVRAEGVHATETAEPLPADLSGDLLVFDLWHLDVYRARPDGTDVRKMDIDVGGSNAAGVASGARVAYGASGGVVAGSYAAGATAGGWLGGPAFGAYMAASSLVLVAPAIGITKAVQISKRHHRAIRSVVQVQNGVSLSPSGDRLLFCSDTAKTCGGSNLRMLDVKGEAGNKTHVRERLRFGGLCPEFSPDGRWALFTAPKEKKQPAQIWRFNADECLGPRQLTSDESPKSFPHFSPDGARIAWQGAVLEGDDAGSWQAFVMSADGAEPRQVSHDPLSAVTPSWSPDGSALVYSSLEDGALWLAPLDGTAAHPLLVGGTMKLHPQLSRDGRYVMYLESSVPPANLQPPEEGETRGKKDKPLVGEQFRLKLTRLSDGATWPISLEKPHEEEVMRRTNLFWFEWRQPAPGKAAGG